MNLSLSYISRPSKTITSETPALFMFHGYGSNKEDLFSFASEIPDNIYIISVEAPYTLQPYGYAWYALDFDATGAKWSDDEQAKTSRDAIIHFVGEACEAFNLSKDNVTLLGFSQGAILSYATALTYPDKIKRVIALSGYINDNIINLQPTEQYNNTNIFASHGSVDQVIPVEWARKTQEKLNALQISTTYKEYPVGHGVAPQNFHDFKNWLLDQF